MTQTLKRPVWLTDEDIQNLTVAVNLRIDSAVENDETADWKKWTKLKARING